MMTNKLYHIQNDSASENIDFIEFFYRGQPREASAKWQTRGEFQVSGSGIVRVHNCYGFGEDGCLQKINDIICGYETGSDIHPGL